MPYETDLDTAFTVLLGKAQNTITTTEPAPPITGGGTILVPPAVLTINFLIDGGGSVITTGDKGFLVVDFDCYIRGYDVLADVSGSIVLDVEKTDYATFPTFASITAAAKPTLSAAQKSQNFTLTGWTTTIAQGDILKFQVDSATTVTRVLLALRVQRQDV